MEKQSETAKLSCLLEDAIRKSVPKQKFGLLFSSGIDSLLLALLFKKMKLDFKCFFGFVEDNSLPKDFEFVKKAAKLFDFELETVSIKASEVENTLKEIVSLVGSSNPVIVGVCLPLFVACKKAKQENLSTVFSGTGADELFFGYARFLDSKNVKKEANIALRQLLKNDLACLEKVAAANNLELKNPFLEKKIIEFACALPIESKLSKLQNKIILRKLATEFGAPTELAFRKKTAAQYGSNSDKVIEKLAKKSGAKGKADYLSRLANAKKIAALFSGGKDSCLALWLMQKQCFDVACLVSILPRQHDSFMYHKPNEKVLVLQAKALEIPLLVRQTRGEKEKELVDLEKALVLAKKKFGIQGVVSGALYSNYQRERIQKICDKLQIGLFSPLWQKKQAQELQELLDYGFVFVMTKIAALGLNKEWLGKQIGKKELVELEKLQASFGFNVAGEGGEYESLVLQAPNFKKKIRIVSSEKKMLNDCTGVLEIKKSVFV